MVRIAEEEKMDGRRRMGAVVCLSICMGLLVRTDSEEEMATRGWMGVVEHLQYCTGSFG